MHNIKIIMLKKAIIKSVIIVILLAADVSTVIASAPAINGIHADPSELFPGRSSIITVNASSTDTGSLLFTYTSKAGSFITWDGNQSQWLSPLISGRYVVNVYVNSTKGGQSFTSVGINVQPAFFKGNFTGLNRPVYISLDKNGDVYVSEPEDYRIVSLDKDNKKRLSIPTIDKPGALAVMNNTVYVVSKKKGNITAYSAIDGSALPEICNNGRFNNPSGIAADSASNILYVSDSSGIHSINMACRRISSFSYKGMTNPMGISFNSLFDNISIADPAKSVVVMLNTVSYKTTKIGQYGLSGSIGWSGFNPGFNNGKSLIRPVSVAEDDFGRFYVADAYQNAVFVYTAQDQFVGTVGYYGSESGAFKNPTSVAIDKDDGILYVADPFNNRVELFSIDKKPLRTKNVSGTSGIPPTTITANAVPVSQSVGCGCSTSDSSGADGIAVVLILGVFMLGFRRFFAGRTNA